MSLFGVITFSWILFLLMGEVGTYEPDFATYTLCIIGFCYTQYVWSQGDDEYKKNKALDDEIRKRHMENYEKQLKEEEDKEKNDEIVKRFEEEIKRRKEEDKEKNDKS